jgi:DNA-binding CsgD family transcriptional regulator
VLVAAGELDRAAEVLEVFASLATRLGAPHALATAARCHGLLEASRGDLDSAFAWYARALDHHARAEHRFELGRTLLAVGSTRRRARQKSAARAVLSAAHEVFDELGATLWLKRTQDELARIAGRRPTGDELTSSEQQVLELASTGRSNKEIAAALHVTVHTVEAHLTRIYRKVGVRSRRELMVITNSTGAGQKV